MAHALSSARATAAYSGRECIRTRGSWIRAGTTAPQRRDATRARLRLGGYCVLGLEERRQLRELRHVCRVVIPISLAADGVEPRVARRLVSGARRERGARCGRRVIAVAQRAPAASGVGRELGLDIFGLESARRGLNVVDLRARRVRRVSRLRRGRREEQAHEKTSHR